MNSLCTRLSVDELTQKYRSKRTVGTVGCAYSHSAFTLIELVVVITIIGVVMGLLGMRLGTFTYWREEAFIRRLSETISFLHHQAMVDQAFYRLEIDFDKNQYSVGVMRPEEDVADNLSVVGSEAGNLSLELAGFLSPSLGKTQTIIPPPSFPSLAEPIPFPDGVRVTDVQSMRGPHPATEGGTEFILFSPRGFSEFGVIHIKLAGGADVTILVNSFTGLPEIFRDYREFEWSYGRNEKDK